MALTTNMNYLTPSNFKISIDLENYKNLVFFVQSFNHPSVNVDGVQNFAVRRARIPLAGDTITYGDLTVNVLLDEDMTSYLEMLQWLERLVNEKESTQSDRFTRSATPTYADITLSILTSKNNVNKQIKYHECVVVSIGDINFEVASQEGSLVFPVTFKFSTFEIL